MSFCIRCKSTLDITAAPYALCSCGERNYVGRCRSLHAEHYESARELKGLTVAEWEQSRGLPPYSVYPDAENAVRLRDPGFFMYRSATEGERLFLAEGDDAA